ncbi:hypothetical protein [Caldifermentibacillus hisashii]|uniref:hypothetical protein n=1 Tax=Caldifermentibacillus hisashii TaxID=996558 RepID=UPI001C10E5E5|nr:hypothetical protein [Caldifermentibacillus hisashii]MBU5341255.1 hypothetical protein [Caldifermentibacillus hisashii]
MKFNFGDLVTCAGYPDRFFTVDSWRVEQHYSPEAEWTETVYLLTDVYSAEWLEADEEDLQLIAKADKADEYLTMKGGDVAVIFTFSDFGGRSGRFPKVAPEIERYNKARERERRINELLDERNDYARLLAEFGDEEYKAKIAEIDSALKEV